MLMCLPMEFAFDDRAVVLKGKTKAALVVSDMHLGYETALEERGVHIPQQHSKMIERLIHLVELYNIDKVYIIGDVKHSILVDSSYNWNVVPEFMESLSQVVKTVIIPGNHDGDLEAILPRSVVLGDVVGTVFSDDEYSVGLIHGHAWPSRDVLSSDLIIMGHNHPAIRRIKRVVAEDLGRTERVRSLVTLPVILRTNLDRYCVCDKMGIDPQVIKREGKLLILPGFNPLLSGIPVNLEHSKLQGPFYDNGCIDYLNSDVLSTQGLFLGKVKHLKNKNQRKH